MPSAIVHFKAAYQYIQAHPGEISDKSKFYIGSVVPDSVNVDGFASKETRTAAHIRTKDLDEWSKQALDFYNSSIGKYDTDYLKGYLFHIYCDILWDRYFEADMISEMKKGGLQPNEFAPAKWKDFTAADNRYLKQDFWLYDVKPALSVCSVEEINGIAIDKIQKYINKLYLFGQASDSEPDTHTDIKYINFENIEKFIQLSAQLTL